MRQRYYPPKQIPMRVELLFPSETGMFYDHVLDNVNHLTSKLSNSMKLKSAPIPERPFLYLLSVTLTTSMLFTLTVIVLPFNFILS